VCGKLEEEKVGAALHLQPKHEELVDWQSLEVDQVALWIAACVLMFAINLDNQE